MDFQGELEMFWAYLAKTEAFPHIPLLYIVIPLGIICAILLFCCCFFCIRACCEENEVRFVPSSLATLQPRRRMTADIIRPGVQDADAGGDIEIVDSDDEPSGTCVQLDESVVDQVNAMYKQRNYRMAK